MKENACWQQPYWKALRSAVPALCMALLGLLYSGGFAPGTYLYAAHLCLFGLLTAVVFLCTRSRTKANRILTVACSAAAVFACLYCILPDIVYAEPPKLLLVPPLALTMLPENRGRTDKRSRLATGVVLATLAGAVLYYLLPLFADLFRADGTHVICCLAGCLLACIARRRMDPEDAGPAGNPVYPAMAGMVLLPYLTFFSRSPVHLYVTWGSLSAYTELVYFLLAAAAYGAAAFFLTRRKSRPKLADQAVLILLLAVPAAALLMMARDAFSWQKALLCAAALGTPAALYLYAWQEAEKAAAAALLPCIAAAAAVFAAQLMTDEFTEGGRIGYSLLLDSAFVVAASVFLLTLILRKSAETAEPEEE